jgi:hypothetical protein
MKKIECLAEIAIQGDQVLSFINCTHDRAIYEVIGFDEPKIVIIDYRRSSIDALHELLESGNLYNFAPVFNTPAQITLQEEESGEVMIELNKASDPNPDKMLWIVIGIKDSLPIYEYLFERISPLTDGSFAFLALLQIPNLEQQTFEVSAFHNQI